MFGGNGEYESASQGCQLGQLKKPMSLRTRLTHLHRRFILRGKYKRRFGYYPNLTNPTSLTEKIQYRKVYDDNPLFTLCSDKYKVRDYVTSKIGSEYLIDMVYVRRNHHASRCG